MAKPGRAFAAAHGASPGPTDPEQSRQYRLELAKLLTRINRLGLLPGLFLAAFFAFLGNPPAYLAFTDTMLIGWIYAIGAAAVVGMFSFVPAARRFGVPLSFIAFLGAGLMMAHLTATTGNSSLDVIAWIVTSVIFCGIYPLPAPHSFVVVAISISYYVVISLATGNATDAAFSAVLVEIGCASFLALALKVCMERLRRRTCVFRAGLEEAHIEIHRLNAQLKEERLLLSRETAVAQRIQRIVLPQENECGAFRDLQVACRTLPAAEVGGDYYDMISFGHEGFLAIGDLTEHGLHSGLVMMMVHAALRALSHVERGDVTRVFRVINRLVYDFGVKTVDPRGMSLAILKYLGDGSFVMTGQHDTLLILRADGTIQDIDTMEYGVYAGLEENAEPCLGLLRFTLHTDDVLVLYTDGITDAADAGGQPFGVQGITEAALPARAAPAGTIRDAIVDSCRKHIGGTACRDDISVLVIKKLDDQGWDGSLHGLIHWGDVIDFEQGAEASLSISFLPLEMFDNWQRGSILSDFTAEYFRHNFPAEEQLGLIATVVNELVENAVKFTANNSCPVRVTLRRAGRRVLIQATNSVARNRCRQFMDVCGRLSTGNLDDLYVERMERGKSDREASGLGLLLIKKDYGARLGFQFQLDGETSAQVAVTAELELT